MAVRLAALLPRAVVVALIWVLATAAFTFAADTTIIGPSSSSSTATPAQTPDLVVPSVVGQVYVFAKGILEDGGFAWRVSGGVRGYAANRVLTQSPAAGTRVLDTGAPTITLRLARGPYAEEGKPVATSSYPGTAVKLANLAAATVPAAPVKKPAANPAAKPVVKPTRKPVVKPKRKPVLKPKRKAVVKPPASRPAAFSVPGAPKEPLDEITLPARALRLDAWLANRERTPANVQHWLYQHAWIVTGAKFGWWHGAQALQTLVAVDRKVERKWGVGRRSELVARNAQAYVRRHER